MVCLKQKDSSALSTNTVIERVSSQGRRMWPLARESADPASGVWGRSRGFRKRKGVVNGMVKASTAGGGGEAGVYAKVPIGRGENLGPTGSGATSAWCGRCGVAEGVRGCSRERSGTPPGASRGAFGGENLSSGQKHSSTLSTNAIIERIFSRGRRMWPLARKSLWDRPTRLDGVGGCSRQGRYLEAAHRTAGLGWAGLAGPLFDTPPVQHKTLERNLFALGC